MFNDMMLELIRLVDNDKFIPRNTISKILDEQKDVINYVERVMSNDCNFSVLELGGQREFYMDLLIRQYIGGREKHYVAKNNGLLLLVQLCNYLSRDDYFDAYREVEPEFYSGVLTDQEIEDLRNKRIRDDEICHY